MRNSLLLTAALVGLGGAALAADLPNAKEPPVPPAPVFTWSGFYVGGQVGYQWSQTVQNLVGEPGSVFISTEPDTDTEGLTGGAHIGYNWQVSQFVLGIEGDVEGTGYSGSELSNSGAFSNTTNIAIEGSARVRVGFAWDQFLFYGTGGAAFASIRNSVLTVGGGPSDEATIGRVGWTAGGGIEYALDPSWTIRAEYRYTDYGSYDLAFVNTVPGLGLRVHETDNRAEAGFSYKFDFAPPPLPVTAKY